jgi:exosortase family protein XrtM
MILGHIASGANQAALPQPARLENAMVTQANTSMPFQPAFFLLVFCGVYALLHCLYFALPDRLLRDGLHHYGIVLPAATIVNLVAPQEGVSAVHGELRSGKASLSIVRGCDGSGLAFLLMAAVVAFPAPLRRKLAGIVVAVGLTYLLNELRLVALYFVAADRHEWFDLLHNFFIPTFLILGGSVFFFVWSAWAQQPAAHCDRRDEFLNGANDAEALNAGT